MVVQRSQHVKSAGRPLSTPREKPCNAIDESWYVLVRFARSATAPRWHQDTDLAWVQVRGTAALKVSRAEEPFHWLIHAERC